MPVRPRQQAEPRFAPARVLRVVALVALVALALPRPALAQATPTETDKIEDFIGRGLETSILLGAGPGPGDAKFRVGDTEIRNSHLLVDVELPFGPLVNEEPDGAGQDLGQGEGSGAGPGVEPAREAPVQGEAITPPPRRYLLQPLLDFRIGYSTAERLASEAVPSVPFVRVKTITQTYASGFGLRLELLERWVHLEPRVTFVYGGSIGMARGGDPEVRRQFNQTQHEVLVGWRAETLTILPIVALELDPPLGPFTMHGALTATVLQTFTLQATSNLQRRERSSVTLRGSLGVDVPIPGFKPGGRQVYLMPSVGYTRLEGDLGALPDTGRNFIDVTLGVAPDLRGLLPLVGRLGLSISYVRGHNLEGYGWDVIWIVAV